MSPLGFDAQEMYEFITKRFVDSTPQIQRQALQWLQKLCLLNIHIPMNILFEMFHSGIASLIGVNDKPKSPKATKIDFVWEDDKSKITPPPILEDVERSGEMPAISMGEENLTCYNLMVDVLNSQMDLQDVEKHVGLLGQHSTDVLNLIDKMISTPWLNEVTEVLSAEEIAEEDEDGITFLEDLLIDYLQLAHTAVRNVINLDPCNESDDDVQDTVQSSSDPENTKEKSSNILKKGPGLGGFMAVLTTMQSTVEKTKEHLDDTSSESSSNEDEDEKEYYPDVNDFDVSVQLVYHLLQLNADLDDADMRYYLLDSVRLLTLHADVLSSITNKRKRFLTWCQDSLLTGILWKILDSTQSQVAQVAVPLLLYSVTLPGGSDVFWHVIDQDFQSKDWRVRFAAVEKVTVLFRFLESRPTRRSQNLRAGLSHAFCCQIACMNDINPQVSLRANLYMGSIHDHAIKILLWCLENQFDYVLIDRPVILKRLYQLFNCLIDRKIITWQFFAARFDVIIMELQNSSDKLSSEFSTMVRSSELKENPNPSKKGIDPAKTYVRSLSANLKYPYKRTISAPAGMGLSSKIVHQNMAASNIISGGGGSTGTTTPAGYQRQQSAPLLKRKTSKQGQDSIHQLNKQISNVGTGNFK